MVMRELEYIVAEDVDLNNMLISNEELDMRKVEDPSSTTTRYKWREEGLITIEKINGERKMTAIGDSDDLDYLKGKMYEIAELEPKYDGPKRHN